MVTHHLDMSFGELECPKQFASIVAHPYPQNPKMDKNSNIASCEKLVNFKWIKLAPSFSLHWQLWSSLDESKLLGAGIIQSKFTNFSCDGRFLFLPSGARGEPLLQETVVHSKYVTQPKCCDGAFHNSCYNYLANSGAVNINTFNYWQNCHVKYIRINVSKTRFKINVERRPSLYLTHLSKVGTYLTECW